MSGRFVVVKRLGGRGGRYFGPFRSRASAVAAQSLLARLFHLRTRTGRLKPGPDIAPYLQGQGPPGCAAGQFGREDDPSGRATSLDPLPPPLDP